MERVELSEGLRELLIQLRGRIRTTPVDGLIHASSHELREDRA